LAEIKKMQNSEIKIFLDRKLLKIGDFLYLGVPPKYVAVINYDYKLQWNYNSQIITSSE
jgi:hypothetical protein